jgi:hypothetical protein
LKQLEIGNKVRVIRSPYFSIKNGTESYIIKKLFERYGENWTMYILDTKPCSTFRRHEIEKIEEKNE